MVPTAEQALQSQSEVGSYARAEKDFVVDLVSREKAESATLVGRKKNDPE